MREQDLIKSVWTGSAFEPDGNWAFAQCNDRLGEGQVVYLDLDPERSKRSHNHQFAFVGIALENLPEHLVSAPFARNADTLRKHALCMTGFCDTNMVALGTEARAERVAAFVSRSAGLEHGYSITTVEGPVVYTHIPHSQKLKAMGAEAFQRSKQAILEWLAELIGVTAHELATMGKKGTAT